MAKPTATEASATAKTIVRALSITWHFSAFAGPRQVSSTGMV